MIVIASEFYLGLRAFTVLTKVPDLTKGLLKMRKEKVSQVPFLLFAQGLLAQLLQSVK